MMISAKTRHQQDQMKTYQDIADSNNQDWRSNNSIRSDKLLWQSMNATNPSLTNTDTAAYHLPYNDQLYQFANTRSYEEPSPQLTNQVMATQGVNSNQQFQFINASNQTTGNYLPLNNSHADLSLSHSQRQYALPLQPLMMPQPSQNDIASSLSTGKQESFFKTSRASSTTSVPSRFERRLKSNASVSSRSSDDGMSRQKSRRSRLGCLTCRHRKKRCCETKPRCAECSRLGLNCAWPVPGTEHKNRSKNNRFSHDEMYHSVYGHIKILRGVVEYKVDDLST